MIIDTHAHLFYDDIVMEMDTILERAAESGISRIIVPAVDIPTSEKIISLCDKYEMIYGAVGFHPGDIKDTNTKDMKLLEEFLQHPKIVAIGEIGLDFYWDVSYKEKQYMRNSTKEAVEIITEKYDKSLKGQFHCFSGDESDLKNILKFDNFYVSFCGNITFKKYKDTDIIKKTPLEKILSETDSPYLSPEPFRGKRNEPSYLKYTMKKLSEIKQIEYDLLETTIYRNSMNLFFTI
ncbi:MAG: TatD family hydrolase [Ignavibacteriae bacterium]|nr:TatD family hydrolase [Ignavibacteriota bacterium]